MWQTYSVLSKNKKPRISKKEFINYYHIAKTEIQNYDLQEFMDFFEISAEDLHIKSKEEILFALRGFQMDREAEKATHEDLYFLMVGNIIEAEFKCVSGSRKVFGKIDFTNQCLEYETKEYPFSKLDEPVLQQALQDLGLMKSMVMNGEQSGDEIWEFEVTGENGMRRLARARICHPEMFLQIIETIIRQKQ